MIKYILFDMYGVILEESKGNFLPYMYAHFPESLHPRLTKLIREDKLFTKAANGEMTSDEFLSSLGFENPQYHAKNYIENSLTLDKGFIPFAEKYWGKYRFGLLSNDVSEWSRHIIQYHGLDKYFEFKVVSGDVKCRKPEKDIFQAALKKSGVAAEDCLFIDNSAENLKAARELGIVPVMFNRDGVEFDGITVNSFEELDNLLKEGI